MTKQIATFGLDFISRFQPKEVDAGATTSSSPLRKESFAKKKLILILPLTLSLPYGELLGIEQQLDSSITSRYLPDYSYQYSVGDGATSYVNIIDAGSHVGQPEFVKYSQYHGITNSQDQLSPKTHDYFNEVAMLTYISKEETYEDGMDSIFTKRIPDLVQKGGYEFLTALNSFKSEFSVDSFGHALRILGRMEDKDTLQIRLWALELSLKDNSSTIRDAAALALAEISEPQGIDYISRAAAIEENPSLKEDMQMILDEWEEDH